MEYIVAAIYLGYSPNRIPASVLARIHANALYPPRIVTARLDLKMLASAVQPNTIKNLSKIV